MVSCAVYRFSHLSVACLTRIHCASKCHHLQCCRQYLPAGLALDLGTRPLGSHAADGVAAQCVHSQCRHRCLWKSLAIARGTMPHGGHAGGACKIRCLHLQRGRRVCSAEAADIRPRGNDPRSSCGCCHLLRSSSAADCCSSKFNTWGTCPNHLGSEVGSQARHS